MNTKRQSASRPHDFELLEHHVSIENVELSKLADEYLVAHRARGSSRHTIENYRQHLGTFCRWSAGGLGAPCREAAGEHTRQPLRFGQVRRFHVENFMQWKRVRNPQISSRSMLTCWNHLRQWFRYLEENYEVVSPMHGMKPPPKEIKPPKSVEEKSIRKVINSCRGKRIGHKYSVLVRLLFDSGLRLSEAIRLKVSNVQDDGTILVERSKTGKPRALILGGKTLLSVLRYKRTLPDGSVWLFPGRCPSRHADVKATGRRLHELGKAAGIEFGAHRLRHSCARSMILAGAGIQDVQHRLGHASPVMSLHYARLWDAEALQRGRQFAPGDRL